MNNEILAIGTTLRVMRLHKGLKQSQVAYKLKYATSYVNHLESGLIKPHKETVEKLLKIYGFNEELYMDMFSYTYNALERMESASC